MERLVKEEYEAWLQNSVTTRVFKYFKDHDDVLKEQILDHIPTMATFHLEDYWKGARAQLAMVLAKDLYEEINNFEESKDGAS